MELLTTKEVIVKKSGMAKPFGAKESKKEEKVERKVAGSKKAYAAMERKMEGKKSTSKMR